MEIIAASFAFSFFRREPLERAIWLAACLTLLGISPNDLSAQQDQALGRSVQHLEMRDLASNQWSLDEIPAEQPVVLVFLGTECPLAKHYGPQVQQLAEALPQAKFFAVFSNSQDSAAEVADYAAEHGLQIPLVLDSSNQLADRLAATRTPEAFVLDRERRVCYHGRIDDQFGIGYSKAEPSESWLRAALEDVLADRSVAVTHVPAVGCLIGRAKQAASGTNEWAVQAARILNRHCVACHRAGEIGPFAMTDPHEVAGWAEMINEVVQEGRMPPWQAAPGVGNFANERRLTAEEKAQIAAWVQAGAPLGDPGAWPAPESLIAGWQLPDEPDLILPVSPRPVTIPAHGDVEYLYFESDHVFAEDTWVQGVQLLPGNHRVVHHILAFVTNQPESESIGQLEGIDGYLAGYVPGLVATPFPAGMAKRIPRGSRLLFQVHYTPIGTEQTDHSKIGLLLADERSIEREVVTTSALRRQLEIPPQAAAHRVTSFSHRRLDDALLLGMMPHMHLRGKSFRYELQREDGSLQPLLQVPAYDFNWQTSYRLAEPISLGSGDRICCVAEYDNSAQNVHNPNPNATVRWGDQTYEEMMIGYFDIAVPRDRDPGRSRLDLRRHVGLVRWWDQFDQDRDGRIAADEISRRLRPRFDALDANGDQQLNFAELASRWED